MERNYTGASPLPVNSPAILKSKYCLARLMMFWFGQLPDFGKLVPHRSDHVKWTDIFSSISAFWLKSRVIPWADPRLSMRDGAKTAAAVRTRGIPSRGSWYRRLRPADCIRASEKLKCRKQRHATSVVASRLKNQTGISEN